MNSSSNIGSRDEMTEEEEYDNGGVSYTLWDNTWEKQTNDLLNIEMHFNKNGKINVSVYTFGNGTKVSEGGDNLDENQVYGIVDKIITEWRKELPSVYKK